MTQSKKKLSEKVEEILNDQECLCCGDSLKKAKEAILEAVREIVPERLEYPQKDERDDWYFAKGWNAHSETIINLIK